MSFGTPLSSIPNTSWMNVSDPVSSAAGGTNLGFSGAASGGAGSMALGPWMLGSTALQGLFGVAGGIMGQQSADQAINEANKNLSRSWGFDQLMREKERGAQMGALREGYSFMNSPVFQTKSRQDFADAYSLAGKFNPYLTGLATRLR